MLRFLPEWLALAEKIFHEIKVLSNLLCSKIYLKKNFLNLLITPTLLQMSYLYQKFYREATSKLYKK